MWLIGLASPLGFAASAAPDSDPVSLLISYGPLGVFVVLFLTGMVVAKSTMEDVIKDRDGWRVAFETEQHAHQETRDALVQANKTAEVALESSNTVAKMLDYLQHPRLGDRGD